MHLVKQRADCDIRASVAAATRRLEGQDMLLIYDETGPDKQKRVMVALPQPKEMS